MVNGILVLDKPAACTSHDIVNRIRRITGERSVGHLGTLDPMATGVLPLVLGRYTRLAQFFNDGVKVYDGEICFGFSTDTYDAEGEAVGPLSNAQPTLSEIQRHLPALTGRILQLPPAYSAKKINGVAAYKLARKDQPVALKPVAVNVRRFEIQAVSGDRARFVAEVSAGTYIRSLAHDLGQALGCGAHLSQLRRTQAGEFTLSQAVSLDTVAAYHTGPADFAPVVNLSEYSLSDIEGVGIESPYLHPRLILPAFPSHISDPATIASLRCGRSVNLADFSDAPLVKCFADQTRLVAICRRIAGTLFHPAVVIG